MNNSDEKACLWCFAPIVRGKYEQAAGLKSRQFCNRNCAAKHTADNKKNIRKTKRTTHWFYPPPAAGNEKGYY